METYVIEITIILLIAFLLGYFFCALIKKSQKNRIKLCEDFRQRLEKLNRLKDKILKDDESIH